MAVMSADTLDLVHDNDEVTHYDGPVMYEKAAVGVNVYTSDGVDHHPEVLRWEATVAAENHGQAELAATVEADDGACM